MCEAERFELTPNVSLARQDPYVARAEVTCKSSMHAVCVRWEYMLHDESQKWALTTVPFVLRQVKVVDNNLQVLSSQVVELL